VHKPSRIVVNVAATPCYTVRQARVRADVGGIRNLVQNVLRGKKRCSLNYRRYAVQLRWSFVNSLAEPAGWFVKRAIQPVPTHREIVDKYGLHFLLTDTWALPASGYEVARLLHHNSPFECYSFAAAPGYKSTVFYENGSRPILFALAVRSHAAPALRN
jgi:hypothetical protein